VAASVKSALDTGAQRDAVLSRGSDYDDTGSETPYEAPTDGRYHLQDQRQLVDRMQRIFARFNPDTSGRRLSSVWNPQRRRILAQKLLVSRHFSVVIYICTVYRRAISTSN